MAKEHNLVEVMRTTMGIFVTYMRGGYNTVSLQRYSIGYNKRK